MKKTKIKDRIIRSTGGKILVGLVLVAMVGVLSPLPAFSQGGRHSGPPDRDRFEGRDRDRDRFEGRDRDKFEGRERDRDRFERRGRDRGRDRDAYYHRRVYRDYQPSHRDYAPPTIVIEPPPPPPGFSIFFPFIR